MFAAWIPAALTAFGALQSYTGAIEAGEAAAEQGQRRRAAAEFEAENARVAAGQAIAASQRDMLEERRKGELVTSRALALAAASGASATDPTVIRLLSRTSGEAAYRASIALYRGQDQARTLRMRAAGAAYEGMVAEQAGYDTQTAYEARGRGALLSGAATAFGMGSRGGLFQRFGAPIEYQDAWSTQGAYP